MSRAVATAVIVLATAGALAAPAAADAAELTTGRDCYLLGARQASTDVSVRGTGFRASSPYALSDGSQTFSGTTTAQGTFGGTLVTGLGAGVLERRTRLAASDGANEARTSFTVARTSVDFEPGSGDPRTLKVRFTVHGMGARRSVYLHWVAPGGRHVETARLGRGRGQCGRLTTKRRRLFPFRVRPGRWLLQADTKRRYSPRTERRARVRVSISRGR